MLDVATVLAVTSGLFGADYILLGIFELPLRSIVHFANLPQFIVLGYSFLTHHHLSLLLSFFEFLLYSHFSPDFSL